MGDAPGGEETLGDGVPLYGSVCCFGRRAGVR